MNADRRFLVLQHIACEPPGAYEDELRARGYSLTRVEVDEGEPLPDWRGFAGLIVMGGPMGAYEDANFPWLAAEKAFIAEAVQGGAPMWGACLGAQLLAASLGAWVGPGDRAEVGVLPVRRTAAGAADPVFAALPAEFPALQWHGDTWAPPAGAIHLAQSDAYPQQAFRFKRAYGVQFHLEVDVDLATEWGGVPAYAQSLEAILGPGALPRLIEDVAAHGAEMTTLARRLFAGWIEHIVEPAAAARGAAAATAPAPAATSPTV